MAELDVQPVVPCGALFVAPRAEDVALSCPARLLGDRARGQSVGLVTLFDDPAPAWTRGLPPDISSLDLALPPAARRSPLYMSFRSLTQERLPDDDALVERAAEILHDIAWRSEARDVYVPLGVGSHIDHRITHEACLRAFASGDGRNVFLYEDRPESLVPGAVNEIRAEGLIEYGPHADEVAAEVTFANGTVAYLDTSRIADSRKRGFRAVYADGVVEIDFLTREIINTTPRPLAELEMGDPLGDAVSSFVAAARGEAEPLVLPEQAARAVETALLIEEAADATIPALVRGGYGRLAATA